MNTFSNKMKTFTAGAALIVGRRVKKSTDTVIYAGAGEDSIGITMANAASGDPILVKLWNDSGTFLIEVDGIVNVNAKVYGAANGKGSATVSGEPIGTANEAAAADTNAIEIIAATAAGLLAIQANVPALTGSLTGTVNGALVDIAAASGACGGSATPSATNVDSAIATAVASIVTGVNEQNKELLTKINAILAALEAVGILKTA